MTTIKDAVHKMHFATDVGLGDNEQRILDACRASYAAGTDIPDDIASLFKPQQYETLRWGPFRVLSISDVETICGQKNGVIVEMTGDVEFGAKRETAP